jgi:polyisoprenoid-binding protein YceI
MGKHEWSLDTSHSAVGFWVRHLMISKVRGIFGKWGGTIELNEADPTRSHVEVQIEAASIDTQQSQRDDHLRSADFLDAGNFPTIAFKSTAVERVREHHYRVLGELTIRDVTRKVELAVEDSGRSKHPMTGDLRAGFSATATIQRSDFGLTWNAVLETGGVALSDDVNIELELQAFRPASAE